MRKMQCAGIMAWRVERETPKANERCCKTLIKINKLIKLTTCLPIDGYYINIFATSDYKYLLTNCYFANEKTILSDFLIVMSVEIEVLLNHARNSSKPTLKVTSF